MYLYKQVYTKLLYFYKKSLPPKTSLIFQYIMLIQINSKNNIKIMKKKKHLHTNFIKFIIEKYSQELPEEETNVSNRKLEDEFDKIINGQEVEKDKFLLTYL